MQQFVCTKNMIIFAKFLQTFKVSGILLTWEKIREVPRHSFRGSKSLPRVHRIGRISFYEWIRDCIFLFGFPKSFKTYFFPGEKKKKPIKSSKQSIDRWRLHLHLLVLKVLLLREGISLIETSYWWNSWSLLQNSLWFTPQLRWKLTRSRLKNYLLRLVWQLHHIWIDTEL